MYYWMHFKLICCLSLVLLAEQRNNNKRELETTGSKEVLRTLQENIIEPEQTLIKTSDKVIQPVDSIVDVGEVTKFEQVEVENDLKDTKINSEENILNKTCSSENIASSENASNVPEKISSYLNENTDFKKDDFENFTEDRFAVTNLPAEGNDHIETTETILFSLKESENQNPSLIPTQAEHINGHKISSSAENPFPKTPTKEFRSYNSDTENITSPADAEITSEDATETSTDTKLNASTTPSSLLGGRQSISTITPIPTRRPLLDIIRRPTTTRRPGTSPGWFSNILTRPSGLLLPMLFLNRTALNNNRTQPIFGFGFLPLPFGRRPIVANSSTPSATRDNGFWSDVYIPLKSSTDESTDKQKETEATGAWRARPNTQVLHLYFPARIPLQAHIVEEALADGKAVQREVNEENYAQNSNNVNIEEKSDVKYEFELPKTIANFVKEVMDKFISNE